jgi:hypothetical protein
VRKERGSKKDGRTDRRKRREKKGWTGKEKKAIERRKAGRWHRKRQQVKK